MKNAASMPQPTITQLRPLHSHQQPSNREIETPSLVEDDAQLLHWSSLLEPTPDENTSIKAFVKLVCRITVLNHGEEYCIQDSARRGFILARRGSENKDEAFSFIDFPHDEEIPTDFSIGKGKALQLHIDAETRQVRLTAQANAIPPAALEALGQMLDDLILDLQQGQGSVEWTQPSVLNIAPNSRPLPLFYQSDEGESSADSPALLHKWFEQRAAENPDRVALDFLADLENSDRTQYTYQQVENAANALADDLARTCPKSDMQTVAVLIGPCPELYISYLAILKAGMAFCPIPVDAPEDRKELLIADLKPVALLVATSEQSEPPFSWLKNTAVINVTPFLAACDIRFHGVPSCSSPTTEADAAYILYTSGTTGMPKGVVVSHLSAACTISALSAHYGFVSPNSESQIKPIRWFQGAAPTFDISLFEIFWTLSTGSTLCCAPRKYTLQDIDKVVTSLQADITNITPSFASLLDPKSIHGLMVGGETLNARLLHDFACYNPTENNKEHGHKPRGIYNGYGPTETAIYCIAQPHVPEGQRGSVLGTPLATCGCLIVDETIQAPSQAGTLQPVPMGAIGELVITGPQVSRVGYLNRPKETASAFVNHERWGRAYRTGDRARIVWNSDGEPVVEFLGRISDDQVKLSGRRVELGEIDGVLASKVQSVRETVSCVWKQHTSETGSEKVVSLVVLDPRADLGFDRVHQNCLEAAQSYLPDYMRPFKILQVDALPRSTSGKVDRKAASAYVREALKEIQERMLEPTQDATTEKIESLSDPEDAELEEELLSIVSDILGTSSTNTNVTLSANTPLAELGMDSLHAMRLLRDVRRKWCSSESTTLRYQHARLQPSLSLLLNSGATIRSAFFPLSQNVQALADPNVEEAQIRNKLADFSARFLPEALDKLDLVNTADIEMVLPATSTQSQLAVSFAMDSRNYISHSILKLKLDASAERLKEAIETVIQKQAIYRSAMLPSDDPISPFAQVILTPEAWNRRTRNERRVVHKLADTNDVVSDTRVWINIAEQNISLESQKLYYIQVIQPESKFEPDSSSNALLVISAAHCICDGPSLELLMNDISREYAGLECIPRQGIYEVVLEWASNVNPNTDQLWRESMEGWEAEGFGALSGNNVNLSASSTDSGHEMVQYYSDLSWKTLEEKSRVLGGSPLSILQAAWSLLLNLYSEADTGDITFGSVISGNHVSSQAPTFSVMPCRVSLPELQSIGELISDLSQKSRFAQSHRHTSFGIFKTLPYNTAFALQAYVPPDTKSERGLGEIIPAPWTEIQNPAIRYDFAIFVEVFPTDPHCPKRNEQFDNMTFKLTYRDDSLSELSATCIAKQLAALTETILGSLPNDVVQELPARLPRGLLSAEGTIPVPTENQEELNQQKEDRVELLHSQFENQAALTPDRLALSFYSSLDSPPIELSYAELDARANGLANILRQEDVEVIPICMQRSVELYVSILAILKAGSAWSPIDETSPVQRRTSLIARTQSKVLLTNTESLPLVEACLAHESLEGVRVILVDQYVDEKTPVRAKPRHGIVSSESLCGQDLAYLLWTSGTTGEPKGVMIQHSAAAQAMRDLQIQIEHDPRAEQVRTLQLSAYSFDVFVQDLFYTWGLSGSVISGTRELVLGTFVEFIWKSRPTHAHLTPSFGASIAVDEIKGSTLQYVTFIGEKLTEDVAEAWAAPEITTRAYNTYGPAENAVVSTLRRFYGKSRDKAKAANVGFPMTPCTSYVVREVNISQDGQKRWELVPRYGVGELALGGAQVAKGYLSNPTKTAKSFIMGGPGIDERIYLTGDTVRLNDHGFEFLGRNDDLVKITGIRIELSEISAACASIKDEESAVEHVETLYLLRPGAAADSNNKVVVTFVSVKKENVDTRKIRTQVFQRARELLPAYMVPGHVVVLETTMPRTASNKVDRKALQQIYKDSDLTILSGRDKSDSSIGEDQQKKLQWTEKQLPILQVIADHFKVAVEPLSPDDSLAGLGFSSLEVTKLAWSLRRQLKCAVGVLDLMRCQFLGELVAVVLSKLPGQDTPSEPSEDSVSQNTSVRDSWVASIKAKLTKKLRGSMRPSDTSYVLPATPMQESLIVETMLEPQAYWSHRVFDLSHLGQIDSARLREAWTGAARKFDILRTIFVPLLQLEVEDTEGYDNIVAWARQQGIQSTILQLVRDEPTIRWNLLSSDENRTLSQWAEKVQAELAPTTTIQPPWSVTLDEQDAKLMLSMHHALYDGVSSQIFLDTVASLYHKQAGNNNGSVVQLERGMGLGLLPSSAQREEAATLWNEHLADLRKSSGALNAPFPDLTQSRQKQPQRILLSRKAIPSSLLTSTSTSPALPTVLQSAFGCVLASYLELKAVVFGQTVSQRVLHPELAQVVGPAVATLPVVVRTDASSAEELWREMSRDSSKLFRITHNLHPVDIKKMLNQGSGSNNTPFPGLFVYHPAPESAVDTQDGQFHTMFREIEQALSLNVEHPLAFNIFEGDGAMELTGDGRRISQAQLELMLDQIIEQARVMVESPQLPLAQLQKRMGRSLISVSGNTTDDKVGPVNPAEGVSLYASEHPDWIAAEEIIIQESADGDDEIVTKTITYDQLNNLANAIASKLSSHEARLQPDDIVALYLSRDIKSLAATLAIFRAGYVYLPVDEELPAARKQLLVRDAKAKVVITTEKLAENLNLDLDSDPPALLLPDGNNDVNTILSWPISDVQFEAGQGGYLLYTSGSTGRPKGVRVSNSNLCHFIASFSARLIESSPATANLGGVGKYLNLTSRAFDPHLTQLFVPWSLGHRVVIGKNRNAMLGSLQQVINELSITHFGSVPSVLTQLGLRPQDVPSVKVVTTGGEKASSELLDTWTRDSSSTDQKDHQEVVLFNFYGPTEVTIGCLGHAVNRDSNARNLGLPLQGLEALLLCPGTGDERVIARRGQPGELYIAGPQVAMGYLDRLVENAKSFQTTSLLGDGDRRMYSTGDMMRMMHDGTLEFLGRADQQAKIRGQRLELDEVVSFMKEVAADEGDLDFAAAVVAIGNDKSNQQQQLFGFVARKPRNLLKGERESEVELLHSQGQVLTSLIKRIEQRCEAGLPAFMVPTILWVTRIPYLVASGKVDTKLLAKLANDFITSEEPVQSGRPKPSASAQALGPEESVVVAAIEEAVGSKINATVVSSIHRLGIDSLSAVHLVSLLRRRGFSKLSMADVLSSSCTVGSITALGDKEQYINASDSSTSVHHQQQTTETTQEVRTLSAADLGPLPVGLHNSQIETVLPCLPLQSALVARSLVWLSADNAEDESGKTADVPYVAQFQYRLSHGTDIAKWKRTAELVIASEAVLRTCLVQREEDGQVFQVVLKSTPFSPFDGEADPAEIVAQMNVRPPIRLQLRKNEDSEEIAVSLKIHHALFDGVAIDTLRQKLEQAYNGPGLISTLTNKSVDILAALSNHCHLPDAKMEFARRSWQERLRGVQPCRIGTDLDKNDAMVRSTLQMAWNTSQLKAKLQAQSKECGVSISPSSAFQLATALCIAHLTQQTTIVYGFVMSLRPLLGHISENVDKFVGPCLNTLVQTLNLQTGSETLSELAQRVHEAHIEACQGAMPFVSVEKVQRWSGSQDKLFDSLLTINFVPTNVDTSSEPDPGRMIALHTKSKSDMALAIDVDMHAEGNIVLTLSSAGALSKSQLNDVGQLFEKIVCGSTDNARVDHFVRIPYDTSGVSSNDHQSSNELESDLDSTNASYQAALTSVWRAICQLLRLKPSDTLDKAKSASLYQMGLDSITVLPFVKLINKSEHVKLTPNAVLKARTIQGVARLLQEMKNRANATLSGTATQKVAVKRDNAENGLSNEEMYDMTLGRLAKEFMFVATPLQEGMLSASLAIAGKAYTYAHAIQLSPYALGTDTPTLDKLFAAIRDTVQACEILRTRFMFTQDDEAPWVGVVSPTEQSDLVQWEVVQSDMPGRVQLRIHHALYDAASIQAMWHILGENYHRRLQELNNDEEAVASHLFRPFAKTVALAQKPSVAFWTNLVQDYWYTPLNFPAESLQASSAFHFTLGEQDLSLLQTRYREAGVATKTALQLAWAKVLCESLYGQADVVYGEVISTGGLDANVDASVVGPTINTVPMRVSLADKGTPVNVAGALTRVQNMSDSVRGVNSMASLRRIQALWRSNHDQENVPASLFQSLFVFDGIVGSTNNSNSNAEQTLFSPAQNQTRSVDGLNDGPAYDDYPLIVSFYIKNDRLHGKLRAKMTTEEVKSLGSRLEIAVKSVLSNELQKPVLDINQMEAAGKKHSALNGGSIKESPRQVEMNGLTPTADAVLEVVKKVLGTRCRAKEIGYHTKLVNAGLDSILAIRLSKLLKKQVGISASVFEIIKGASVHDIVKRAASAEKFVEKKPRQLLSTQNRDLKELVAKKLGISVDLIKSILPVLAGQQSHLEQWLLNGKRFLEAPWVYRVVDTTIDAQKVSNCWAELCRVHESLRTTFAWTGNATGLVQTTLSEQWIGQESVAIVQDPSQRIQSLIEDHVSKENAKPSDLREPPACLSFLEASDGKALVLRVHHALYDAWSIKMIQKDLNDLLTSGEVLQARAPLQQIVEQVREVRQPDAEDSYWKQHLSHAQDTVLQADAKSGTSPASTDTSPLGRHFKAKYPNVIPASTFAGLSQSKSNAHISASILLAYAKTLGHFTACSRPTFGLNHASRSLSSADGARTIDLTCESVPTLTMTPFCVHLENEKPGSPSNEHLLDYVQDHLAQLTKFAQVDDVQKYSPRFNTYLNILYPGDNVLSEGEEVQTTASALSRQRLNEPLASDYFTITKPSSIVSTIENLETSHLCPHRLFLNVLVQGQDISVAVSGDEVLGGDGRQFAAKIVNYFGAELSKIIAN